MSQQASAQAIANALTKVFDGALMSVGFVLVVVALRKFLPGVI